ncbi:unnamed protein product [Cunninghamella blakesleeana]
MSSDKKPINESNGFLNSWINTLIFGNEETKTTTPSSMIEQPSSTTSFQSNENQTQLPQRPISHPLPTVPLQHHHHHPSNNSNNNNNNNQKYDHPFLPPQNNKIPRPLPNVPLNHHNHINQYQYIHPHPNHHRLSTPMSLINNDLHQQQQQKRTYSLNALNSDQTPTSFFNEIPNMNPLPLPSNNNNNQLFSNQAFLATDLTLNETTENNNSNNNTNKKEDENEEEKEKENLIGIEKKKIDMLQQMDTKEELRPSKKHYGPAPLRTRRRYGTKRMHLTSGNLVVENPVPMTYLSVVPRKDDEEFRKMRYTAATCDADLFLSEGYKLRQQINNRETEIHIVITMYNEDEILFARTMHGVMQNIHYLCNLEHSKVWGADSWKKVVVTIVADGRKIIQPRVLNILSAMGVYQEGLAKNVVDDKPVTAHIYEYTTQISFDEKLKKRGATKKIVPTQIIFCLKEKNAKKINSHRWFFNAFSKALQPKVCILLDVGTQPGYGSIYELWKCFDRNSQIAGACGEIRCCLGSGYRYLFNPLVAAQNFEYKMSNILDKPMESVFGYIAVLPGAFSAYRYTALQNDVNGHGPLEKYFKGETLHAATNGDDSHKNGGSGLFEANMYLAEDRILCFELVAKKGEKWLLHYCKSAYATTDVPDQLPEFISQRRRWLNGSFFAGVYGLWHFSSLWKSRHSCTRKLLLTIEAIYNVISLIFSWLTLANLYITFFFITKSLASSTVDPFQNGWGSRLFDICRFVYLFLIVIVFICSMGNRPQGAKWLFLSCLIGFSILMLYIMFASFWLIYKGVMDAIEHIDWTQDASDNTKLIFENSNLRNMVMSLLATYGLYFVSSVLYLQPWHIFTSLPQYLLLLPGYVNILNIYAFCNTHDVSWGTKGDNTIDKDLGVVKKISKKESEVELEMPSDPQDIENVYGAAIMELERKVAPPKTSSNLNQEDGFRSFRTHLVLLWLMCNALLITVVTSSEYDTIYVPSIGNNYMLAILWTNAGLAAFKFVSAVVFLVLRVFKSY